MPQAQAGFHTKLGLCRTSNRTSFSPPLLLVVLALEGATQSGQTTGTIVVPIDLEESKEHYNDLRMLPRYRQG